MDGAGVEGQSSSFKVRFPALVVINGEQPNKMQKATVVYILL